MVRLAGHGGAMPSRVRQKLYDTKRWRRLAAQQLRLHPLCVRCLVHNEIVPATIVDHVIPHRGNVNLFWCGELQSLCLLCHTGSKQFEEKNGFDNTIGNDGWPVDPKHPSNRIEKQKLKTEMK